MVFFPFINDINFPIFSFQVVVQVVGHHGTCCARAEYYKIFHYC